MPAFHPRIRALAVGIGAFALVAVAAGGTFAASNPATLYACYDVYGNVKMGDTAQCKLAGGGRLVSWSTVGVPGPTGPMGPTGPTGGLAGYQIVTRDWIFGDAGSFTGGMSVSCPAGKVVTGGGLIFLTDDGSEVYHINARVRGARLRIHCATPAN